MGTGRGHHRPRDRRRHAAREESRRDRRRRFPIASWPMKRRCTIGRTMPRRIAPRRWRRPEFSSARSERRPAEAARLGRSVFQALDLAAVRLHGSHQYPRGSRRRRRHRAHQGNRNQRRDVARRQWPLLRAVAARRREADRRRVLPQSVDRGRAAGGRDQQSEFRQSRAAGDHGADWSKRSRGSPRPARFSRRRSPAATSACTTKRWAKRSGRRRSWASSG